MAKYLFRVSYTPEGVAGLLKEGAKGRTAAIRKLVTSAGGKMEAGYWAFGEDDYVLIADLPDHAAAVAVATTSAASGAVSVSTTVLLTAEEMDQGIALGPQYRAPGA